MKLLQIKNGVMAAALILGGSACCWASGVPQAQSAQDQTQPVDQTQNATVPAQASELSGQNVSNPNGEPGTVYRMEVVASDGSVQVEFISHPRYDDTAFTK